MSYNDTKDREEVDRVLVSVCLKNSKTDPFYMRSLLGCLKGIRMEVMCACMCVVMCVSVC